HTTKYCLLWHCEYTDLVYGCGLLFGGIILGMAKVGAPTKYTSSMPKKALDIIGSQGKSITQFARDMRVTRETVYEWARVHKEFSDALQRAKQWSEAHWEDEMESMMYDREVNA